MSYEHFDKQTGTDREPPSERGTEEKILQNADATTGASPGTAQACSDLGLNSLASNLERFGINPPGQS